MGNDIQHTAPSTIQSTTKPRITDEQSKAKLAKAARDFESLFVNYLLKSMRKTVEKADQSEDGFGGEMMQEMFDEQVAKSISRNASLGFGEMLYKKMTGESLPKAYASDEIKSAFKQNTSTNAKAADAMKRTVNPIASPKTNVADEIMRAVKPIAPAKAHHTDAFVSSKNVKEAVAKFDDFIASASEKYDVDSTLLRAVIATESAGNPNARSPKNAKGLMQLIDSTATMVGVKNVWDPEQNIHGGAKYLRQLLDQFDGNVKLAVASYNAGPARVEKAQKVPAIPETQEYVKRVMKYLDVFSLEKE
jgi:soluble lytic murein transglycosylase-like protein